uniref:Uncharacterized protein n=1 Tax=Romanomermis culicivorax TaxID=13658 RepID=A0A915IYU3_ROMCU
MLKAAPELEDLKTQKPTARQPWAKLWKTIKIIINWRERSAFSGCLATAPGIPFTKVLEYNEFSVGQTTIQKPEESKHELQFFNQQEFLLRLKMSKSLKCQNVFKDRKQILGK